MTAISGNTYPVKDQLKALGARWDKAAKAWMVDDSKAEQARVLVAAAPKGYVRTPRYNRRESNYASRGGYDKGARGMCEDAPCCGCCGNDSYGRSEEYGY